MPGASLHGDGTTSTAEEDGDVAVAQAIQERMVLDGSRLQVKEWLFDALESCGWCATMDRAAAQYSSENSSATVGKICEGVARKGFGKYIYTDDGRKENSYSYSYPCTESVPEEIRNKLIAQLLAQVQMFDTSGASSAQKSKSK